MSAPLGACVADIPSVPVASIMVSTCSGDASLSTRHGALRLSFASVCLAFGVACTSAQAPGADLGVRNDDAQSTDTGLIAPDAGFRDADPNDLGATSLDGEVIDAEVDAGPAVWGSGTGAAATGSFRFGSGVGPNARPNARGAAFWARTRDGG